jgi:hypothetical protein
LGKAEEVGEVTGICTLPPDGIKGSSILGKICRDNVGKNRFPAGVAATSQDLGR